MEVRATRCDDGTRLREMEVRAGQRFRQVGLDHVADDEPPSAEALGRYAAAGRSWVAVDDLDEPLGYVVVDVVDGDAHVEQLTVSPEQQGRGVGRALLACVQAWAIASARSGITLTTFAHVPWNRPLFEHLGFRVLRLDEIGSELQAIREAESARGLDPTMRVCMRLDLGG